MNDKEFRTKLTKQETELRQLQAQGKTSCLTVMRYPRAKRHLMYVYEGFQAKDQPGFVIPWHFFQFQEFRPELMRLKDDDYFRYSDPSRYVQEQGRKYRAELILLSKLGDNAGIVGAAAIAMQRLATRN